MCIHISQFISATIWAIRQGSPVLCQWARPERSCTWHIHCGHQRCEDKVTSNTSHFTKILLNNGEIKHIVVDLNTEHVGYIYVCCVRAGQKWKITGAIKLERTDCQTEGKQVFEAIIVTLACVLTIMWHHIFLSPVPPLLYLTRTHSSSALLLAAFHARIDNDSSNTLDWILILEQWVECSFLGVDPVIQGIQECQEGCGGPEESQE